MAGIYYLFGLFFVLFNLVSLANFSRINAFRTRLRENPGMELTGTQSLYGIITAIELVWWVAGLLGRYWPLMLFWLLLSLLMVPVVKRISAAAFALQLAEFFLLLFIMMDVFHLHLV